MRLIYHGNVLETAMMRLAQYLYLWYGRRSLIVLFSGLFCLLSVGHYAWVNAGLISGLWGPCFACEPLEFNCGEVSTDKGLLSTISSSAMPAGSR